MEVSEQKFEENIHKALGLMGILNNKNRLKILCKLVQKEMRVSDLLKYFDISQSALSQNLIMMREVGIIGSRNEGSSVFYHIKKSPALEILNILYQTYCEENNDN